MAITSGQTGQVLSAKTVVTYRVVSWAIPEKIPIIVQTPFSKLTKGNATLRFCSIYNHFDSLNGHFFTVTKPKKLNIAFCSKNIDIHAAKSRDL